MASLSSREAVSERREAAFSPAAVALAAAIIALAAVVAYYNSFAGVFVFDDYKWIVNNTNIWHLWPISRVLFPPNAVLLRGRPVVGLTLAVNYALGGANVWGYHAVNLAIHILAAWTLLGVVRRTLTLPQFRRRFASAATPLALVVALLWTVHPLQTESITYIIQRMEALVGLFYLLTLYCVIRGATARRAGIWYVAAVVACLLGMGTKELMATAPVIVLLYDRTFLAGSFREAWRRRYALYLAMAATWGVIVVDVISTEFYGGTAGFAVQKFTWWSYLLTQPGVIVHYLRLVFWPSGLCLDYNWPPARTVLQIVLPGSVIVGLLALTIWAIRKRPAWGFLGAWFFVILAPTSSFVPIRDAAFEHRMYLSLAAVVAGVVIGGWVAGRWIVDRGTLPPVAARILGCTLVAFAGVAFAILTVERNMVYRSELLIWQDVAAKVPGNQRAQNNLGLCLSKCERIDEAIEHYRKALEIDPEFPDAHNGLGAALAGLGRYDEAEEHYRRAIKIVPNFADACNNFGLALARQGKFEEAVIQYQKALRVKPELVETYGNMGLALARCGRVDEAMASYRKAIEIKWDNTEAHCNLGVALANRGENEEAIVEYRKTLEIDPRHVQARGNLALALAACGRMEEAITEYRKALEIKPEFAEAHNNFGRALGQVGREKEAIAQYRKALEIKPDYAEPHYNLGLALAGRGRCDEAMAEYRQALAIKADYADAHNNLGIALMERGQDEEASRHLRKALEIEPDYAEAHNNLGIVLAQRGRMDEAIMHFRRAIKIKPDFADARKNLAFALEQQGKTN